MNSGFRDVVEADTDDFPSLLRLSKLNPAFDLIGCSFAGVNFGALDVPVLNLNGCDLLDADLSGVTGRITTDGANTIGVKWPNNTPLKDSVIARRKIHDRFSVLRRLARHIHRFEGIINYEYLFTHQLSSARPLIFTFRSVVEQDLLEKELNVFARPNTPYAVISLSSQTYPFQRRFDTIAELDEAFQSSVLNALSKISNQKITAQTHQKNRAVKVRDYLEIAMGLLASEALQRKMIPLFILSGFPPISQELYVALQKAIPGLRIVLTCPDRLASANQGLRGLLFARSFTVKRPIVMGFEEISALKNFFQDMGRRRVKLSQRTENFLNESYRKDISQVKNYLLSRVMENAKERREEIIL